MTVSPRDIARRRAWAAALMIGAGLILVFYLLPAGSIEQSVVYDIVGLGAVATALLGLRLHRPAGTLPWVLLAAGQLAFVGGDTLWTVFTAQGQDPFPSVADASYLIGYPLLSLGLLIAIRRRIAGGDRAGLLDAAILTTGAAVVWWAFVLGPLAAASDPEPVAFAISIAYPISDLLLIGILLGLAMTPGARSFSFGSLAGSLVLILVADLVFGLQSLEGTYVDGGWLDGVWLLAYVAFGAAAIHPSMAGLFEPRPIAVTLLGRARLVLLGVAMLVGPALLVMGRSDVDAIVLVVAAATAVLSVLVLVRLAGMVRILARDIARRRLLEEQLSYHAYHDPLTGLANRRRFVEAIEEALASGTATAVLFLDLDDFKHVNDDMGHEAGDALLSAMGHRILDSLRPADLACRLGGDEFAVLLPNTPRLEDAEAVATRLLEIVGTPVDVGGVAVHATASVGVALRQAGEVMSIDDLIRRSDVAMYHAKARGKHRSATYSAELEELTSEPAAVRTTVRRNPTAA
ncbi:MAG: GGDEF domain-containing protein [Chloroflexi bacterium]|nr:GGDEF domain-containing protein [Chloroflexota bacterium]